MPGESSLILFSLFPGIFESRAGCLPRRVSLQTFFSSGFAFEATPRSHRKQLGARARTPLGPRFIKLQALVMAALVLRKKKQPRALRAQLVFRRDPYTYIFLFR